MNNLYGVKKTNNIINIIIKALHLTDIERVIGI